MFSKWMNHFPTPNGIISLSQFSFVHLTRPKDNILDLNLMNGSTRSTCVLSRLCILTLINDATQIMDRITPVSFANDHFETLWVFFSKNRANLE
ncbi:hypothetical protein CEXT_593531 [Caerostris extrusa]|uniref:Uncharacterized protein n=1 Tax=Caerostris extrusa TaxID=172846 RepID=A0AAV4NK47_CAEEX|nr:hypothetical protein CEXT_593531 [Caerostris extrusa]